MQDNTLESFLVQEEKNGGECGGLNKGGYQGGPQVGYGHYRGYRYGGGGSIPPTCFNCSEIGHVSQFLTIPCLLCTYFYNHEHATEDCPEFLKKW